MFKTRVLSAAIGIPLIIGLTLWGRIPFFVFILTVTFLGLYEFYQMLRRQHLEPNLVLGMGSSFLYIFGALLWKEKGLEASLILVVAIYFLWYLLVLGKPTATLNCAFTIFGSLYIGFLLSYLILIYRLPAGRSLVLLVLGATWVADTAAYGVGTLIGRRKLAPKISPSKTWEGITGAVLITSLVTAGLYFIPLTFEQRLIFGLIVGIASQLGDLAESKLKREMAVKDAGQLIPGHGGILDRFDSLLFSGIVAYYYLKLVL